jgi:hypothetical protein
MSNPTVYAVSMRRSPGLDVRMDINLIPFKLGQVDNSFVMEVGGLNAYLRPGKNLLSFDYRKVDPVWEHPLEVYVVRDADFDRPVVHHVEGRIALARHEQRRVEIPFEVDGVARVTPFLDGEPSAFDCSGTDAQYAAVAEIHDAYRRRDKAAVARVRAALYDAHVAAYAPARIDRDKLQKRQLEVTERLEHVAPLPPKQDLHFERLHEGRLCCVTRRDGGPVLAGFGPAATPDGGAASLDTNFLLLSHLGGGWRLIA